MKPSIGKCRVWLGRFLGGTDINNITDGTTDAYYYHRFAVERGLRRAIKADIRKARRGT